MKLKSNEFTDMTRADLIQALDYERARLKMKVAYIDLEYYTKSELIEQILTLRGRKIGGGK